MSDQKVPAGLSQKAIAAFLSAIADIIAEILPQDGRSESLQELKEVLREKMDRRLATVRLSDHPLNPIESAEVDVLLETFLGAFDLAYTNRQKSRGGGGCHTKPRGVWFHHEGAEGRSVRALQAKARTLSWQSTPDS